MTEHGGNEEIMGGDATPRNRVAKAAQEAFYDLSTGGAIEAARQHVMEAYDGAERARFEQALAEAVGGLVDDLDGGNADIQGFVGDLMDEYDRRYADEEPWRTERLEAVRFLEKYAYHYYAHHGSPIEDDGTVLLRAAKILRGDDPKGE